MSTPRTDEAWRKYVSTEYNADQAIEVSRQLERELAAATERAEKAEAELESEVHQRDGLENVIEAMMTAVGLTQPDDYEWSSEFGYGEAIELVEEKIAAGEADLKAAREDSARLDWLEKTATLERGNCDHFTDDAYRMFVLAGSGYYKQTPTLTLRAAIDASRQSQEGGKK